MDNSMRKEAFHYKPMGSILRETFVTKFCPYGMKFLWIPLPVGSMMCSKCKFHRGMMQYNDSVMCVHPAAQADKWRTER